MRAGSLGHGISRLLIGGLRGKLNRIFRLVGFSAVLLVVVLRIFCERCGRRVVLLVAGISICWRLARSVIRAGVIGECL